MKKFICTLSSVVVALATVITLCSFTASNESEVDIQTSCQGKNCNGNVGCSCPGFSPITDEEVYRQAYCKHCGHHRNYHK